MPVLAMKRLRKSYRKRNYELVKKNMSKLSNKIRTFEIGELVDCNTFDGETVFYIQKGCCTRYFFYEEKNKQTLNMAVPHDILGLSTKINELHIPGGVKVIERLVGIEISLKLLMEWSKKDPLFLYENLQYDVLLANNSIRMNGMDKKEKIYYNLIELLRENHLKNGTAICAKKYITQMLISEYTASSKGYISKVIKELRSLEILNPYSVNLICDKPQALLALSETHRRFSVDDVFN